MHYTIKKRENDETGHNVFCIDFNDRRALWSGYYESYKNQQHRMHFVDKDGDGYNDNAPDHDGDGIPNGLDPDWHKLMKEKGKKKGKKHGFIDLNGDGINDYFQSGKSKAGKPQPLRGEGNPQGNSMDNAMHKGKRHHGDKKGGKQ